MGARKAAGQIDTHLRVLLHAPLMEIAFDLRTLNHGQISK
jgi:hypothetical protein